MDEATLIRRVQDGATDRFAELIRPYRNLILAELGRATRNPADAEDLYQAVLLSVWRALPGYEHRNQFPAWLRQVARNAALDDKRRARARPQPVHIEPWMTRVSEDGPEQLMVAERRLDHLERVFEALPPDQQQMFLDRFAVGLTFREIAERRRQPIGTVLSRLHRIRRRMLNAAGVLLAPRLAAASAAVALAILLGSSTRTLRSRSIDEWRGASTATEAAPLGGAAVAYQSTVPGETDIYLWSIEDGSARRLTRDPSEDAWPAISPDGRTMAFFSRRSRGTWLLYSMDVESRTVRRLTDWLPHDDPIHGVPGNTLHWHPDGDRLLFNVRTVSGLQLFELDVAGGPVRRLTTGPLESQHATYSRDGTRIIMMRNVPQSADTSEIWIARADGTSLHRLTDTPGHASRRYPAEIVVGQKSRILYLRNEHPYAASAGAYRLFTMAMDGTDHRAIDLEGMDGRPHLGVAGPAGSILVAATSLDMTRQSIWQVDLAGTTQPRLLADDAAEPHFFVGREVESNN